MAPLSGVWEPFLAPGTGISYSIRPPLPRHHAFQCDCHPRWIIQYALRIVIPSILLLLNVFVDAPLCRRMTGESLGRNSHVISYWTLFCRDECGGMFWLTLHEVYAICNLCIFGDIIRGMLRRILFLHIVSLPWFVGHSFAYGVYLSLFLYVHSAAYLAR